MNQNPYSSYRGRTPLGRRLLIALVILLTLALCALLAWRFWLSNYVIYDENGPHLVLGGPLATPAPSGGEDEPQVVIDIPTAAPSPTPGVNAEVDLSQFTRRKVPLGLVTVTGGKDPAVGQGAVFDMTDMENTYAVTADTNAEFLYAAAYLGPDWSQAGQGSFDADLTDQCVALAALGFDELIFAPPTKAQATDALAKCYLATRQRLDDLGWQGRLGLVVNQDLFTSSLSEDLQDAMAGFHRLYFQNSMRANVNKALRDHGFAGTPGDIVTLYAAPPKSVTWSWAVLPQQT